MFDVPANAGGGAGKWGQVRRAGFFEIYAWGCGRAGSPG